MRDCYDDVRCVAATDLARLRRKLETDPSVESRTEVATSVGSELASALLTPGERQVAEEIVALVANDISETVRRAVADSVRHCAFLPRETALALADDVASVALPFLEHSPALSDEDLLWLIGEVEVDGHQAIASRHEVGEEVSGALVATGNRNVVGILLKNPGARIAPLTFGRMLDSFGADTGIQALMTDRPDLPSRVAIRMVRIVSDELRERLVAQHDIPPDLAADLATSAGEHAVTEVLAGAGDEASGENLVRALREEGMLLPGLALRALCAGDNRLFVNAMADLSGLPYMRIWVMLNDNSGEGFRKVYERAGLPPLLFGAFRAVFDLVREKPDIGPAERQSLVVARLIEVYDRLAPTDIEHILSQFALWLRLDEYRERDAVARKPDDPQPGGGAGAG